MQNLQNNYIDYTSIITKNPPIYNFVKYTPTWLEKYKNTDLDGWQHDFMKNTNQNYNSVPVEVSDFDRKHILDYMNSCVSQDGLIVEIGVWRDPSNKLTSTQLFLENKKNTCTYLGIDIEDRPHVQGENVFMLKTDSGRTEYIRDYINQYIKKPIDFLYIDGLHSLEQVQKELDLVNLLKTGGVVGFHDISVHAGPNLWLDAFDENKFEVSKYRQSDDWGVGFCVKKN